MTALEFIMAFEEEEMTGTEFIKGFQGLIDKDVVWSLQGAYGRMATELIEAGLCHRKEV